MNALYKKLKLVYHSGLIIQDIRSISCFVIFCKLHYPGMVTVHNNVSPMPKFCLYCAFLTSRTKYFIEKNKQKVKWQVKHVL